APASRPSLRRPSAILRSPASCRGRWPRSSSSGPIRHKARRRFSRASNLPALYPLPCSTAPDHSAARHRIDVLDRTGYWQCRPGLAAILSAEHLTLVARADIDLIGVARVEPDRHDCAVDLHLVEAPPGLAGIVAAVETAVVARGGDAQRRVHGLRVL